MRTIKIHSHFGGYEHIHIHCPQIWAEVYSLVQGCDNPFLSASSLAAQLEEQGWARYGAVEFIKERVALNLFPEVQEWGAYGNQAALFAMDRIDVGIEIFPMKSMRSQMSSGVAHHEDELYNVVRNGRGAPAVPLVILGIGA